MTYKLLSENADINGTSLQEFVDDVSLNELSTVLGQPVWHPDYNPHCQEEKILVEWVFSFGGRIMTLYLWKWYRMPGVNDRVRWNLGGKPDDYTQRQSFMLWLERKIIAERTTAKVSANEYPLGI